MNGIKRISRVEVIIFPRIHISLIGLNHLGYRKNGGIGFAIDNPSLKLSSELSSEFVLIDNRDKPFTIEERKKVTLKVLEISKELKLTKNLSVSITGKVDSHLGFGSGTSIRLAIIESLLLINEFPYDRDLLISLSKRGGTSGIGVNTYFDGGYIFDIGRKDEFEDQFLPSNANENFKLSRALVLSSLQMPNWKIGLCIPKDLTSVTVDEEIKFFELTCPITDSGVFEILYHSVYGTTASIIEGDFDTFCNSINKLQQCEWKRSERALHGDRLLEIEANLLNCGAKAVGLSSLGPLMFFLASDLNDVIKRTLEIDDKLTLLITNPMNSGRRIKYD